MDANNGEEPRGSLVMDASGNIYGTTVGGGADGLGTVYELSPQTDRTYSFSILYSFSGSDGLEPEAGLSFDSAGNLYGTASAGGRGRPTCQYGCGVVFELSPSVGGWEETVLLDFDGVLGAYPLSPISIDEFGNLYGTFETGGGGTTCYAISCGGVFKLIPYSNRKYVFDFSSGPNSGNPQSGVVIGPDNTLYGTEGIFGGQVYMLQNSQETVLYNFGSLPNCADGSFPNFGNVVIHDGALYGTTNSGGLGIGVVYSPHEVVAGLDKVEGRLARSSICQSFHSAGDLSFAHSPKGGYHGRISLKRILKPILTSRVGRHIPTER